MANKGQRRGNREAKKPKKEKTDVARDSTGAPWTTLERIQAKDAPHRKR